MKAFVIGYGSIGSRHIQNLSLLSNMEIIIQTNRKSNKFLKKNNCKIVKTLLEGIKECPDFAMISNETSFHLKTSKILAKYNIPFFIEKPLSHTLNGVDELLKIVKKKNLITLMGCPLRFHPCLMEIKLLLDKKAIGKILSIYSENGSFLPDWHPKEDYRKSYSANKNLGGGVLLTNIHEIDYLYWFFGKIYNVYGSVGKISNLEINVEDYASVHLFFKNILAELHLDFFQIPKSRQLKIIGDKGIIDCNLVNCTLKLYSNKTSKWKIIVSKPSFDFNTIYIDELDHFIDCIKNKKNTINPITIGAEVLKTVFLIKKSAKEKRMLNYNDL